MLEFWWKIALRQPCLAWESLSTLAGWITVGAFVLLIVSKPLGRRLLNWDGINPRWALIPLFALFLYANARSIYEDFETLRKENVGLRQEQASAKMATHVCAKLHEWIQSGEALERGILSGPDWPHREQLQLRWINWYNAITNGLAAYRSDWTDEFEHDLNPDGKLKPDIRHEYIATNLASLRSFVDRLDDCD